MEQPGTTQSRRRFLTLLGAGAAGATGLAACSSGEESAADVAGGGGAATTTTAAAVGEPCAMTDAGVPAGPLPVADDLAQSGYLWTAAQILLVTTGIDGDLADRWLPPNLSLTAEPTATFFVAHYPLTSFGSVYNESAVLVHVEDERGPAVHCPWMVVDEDTALNYGRELLGFPKKMADIRLREDGGRLIGTVNRRGTEVLHLEAERGVLAEEAGAVWGDSRIINAHGSVIGGMALLDIPPLPEVVHERHVGTGTVTLASAERDPLAELGAAGEGDAVFTVVDFAEFNAGALLTDPIPLDWAYEQSFVRSM